MHDTLPTPAEIALDLIIKRGIAPVPIPLGKKSPTIKQWHLLRISAAEVPQYFDKKNPNVGAIMGPASGGLTDVDLDCTEAMALAPRLLPTTKSIYGRPGKPRSHYLYTCNDPDPGASTKWVDETGGCIVELRRGGGGKGSQSVMPGSIHTSGERYAWNVDGIRGAYPYAELKAAVAKIAVGTMLIRHWPSAGSRHDACLALGGFFARAGWSADEIEYFVTTICSVHGEAEDPAAHGKTAKNSAERHADGGNVGGLPTMIEVFGDKVAVKIAKHIGYKSIGAPPNQQELNAEIEEINKDHALVLAGNKAAIMKFESATKFRLLQVGAFKQWFANQMIQVGKKLVPLGEHWLGHPQRKQYAGIEFEPTGGRQGYYNLWQGFAVEPKAGDCSLFLAHVHDNAARGDASTYNWIVGWWAQIAQQLAIKMETALALRGELGTGKTKVGQVFGSLFGPHYLSVSSPRYITRQFNSHMASLLVLHAEEAFWAGDKKEGILKDLVSGIYHMLEYKTVDPFSVKNHVRLFVTGNSKWLIPAGFKERRWAVFDMGDGHIQDHPYFAAIDKEMDSGGRAALLRHLLDFDLSKVNLRVIPKTAALLDQQIESLTPEQAWWLDMLMSGELPWLPDGAKSGTCTKAALHQRYVHHAKLQGVNRRSTETRLGDFLTKQLGAELVSTRPRLGKDYRPTCYELPPLKECRMKFAQEVGQSIEWGAGWEGEVWQHVVWRNDDQEHF